MSRATSIAASRRSSTASRQPATPNSSGSLRKKGYKVLPSRGKTGRKPRGKRPWKKRNGLRCIVDAPRLVDKIFDRLRPFLPARKRDGNGAEWRLVGLNERLRFLKYNPGMHFLQHPDGARPSCHAVP